MSDIETNLKKSPMVPVNCEGGITNKLTPTDWDDTNFAVFNAKYADWLYLKDDLSIGVSNALFYIATYFDVVSPSAATQIENLKSLLSYMKLDDKYIFQTTSKKPASTPPEIDPSKFTFKNISFYEKAQYVRLNNGTTIGAKEVNKFWNDVYEASMGTDNNIKQEIIDVACFLFLMMYRCTKKEATQIYIHVPSSGTTSYCSIFKPNPINFYPLPPPSSSYVKSFKSTFSSFSPNALAVATKLIQSWICHKGDPKIIGMLNAGCLLTLRFNGLGSIGWALKAALSYCVKFREILLKVSIDPLVESQAVALCKFLSRENKGDSWPWCRLFENSALFNLSTKANPNLCVICALIVMVDPAIVMKMSQFSRHKYLVTHYTPDTKAIIKSLFP